MAQIKYPFKRNGYVYSPDTAEGFRRMRRLGIPGPVISIENQLARILKIKYRAEVRQILQDIKTQPEARM